MSAERRRAELEAKRAKLAELKALREQRRSTLTSASNSTSGRQTPIERPPSSKAQLDDIINSLLAPSNGSTTLNEAPAAAQGDTTHTELSAPSEHGQNASLPANNNNNNTTTSDPAADESYAPFHTLPTFADASQELFELPPPPAKSVVISYDKSVQTTSTSTEEDDDLFLPPGTGSSLAHHRTQGGSSSSFKNIDGNQVDGGIGRESEPELRARLLAEFEAERTRLDNEIAQAELEAEQARRQRPRPDELQAILSSSEFNGFLEENSKIVQRALSDRYDYLRDYALQGVTEDGEDIESGNVKCTHTFYDERWTRHRPVSAVDWSHKFPELSMSAYGESLAPTNDPHGIVALWNLHLKERPEYIFHAPSAITSAMLSPFQPNLIVGGTYTGQILVWDSREKSLPVLKSPLTSQGHTHPVYSLALPGTQNAHNLISVSTDGMLCSWQLDMLAKPASSMPLVKSDGKSLVEVSPTCMAFPANEPETFWVGTEDGTTYDAHRTGHVHRKAGIGKHAHVGHAGPVTGIDFHPVSGHIDFGDLFLTSSVDWTVRLWKGVLPVSNAATVAADTSSASADADMMSTGDLTSASIAPTSSSSTSTKQPSDKIKYHAPIQKFDTSEDYVFDVKWHPNHPAMFASVNGAGQFDLWNLVNDHEVPVARLQPGGSEPKALNKMVWDKQGGRRAALGASDGRTHVVDIGQLHATDQGDWDATYRTLQALGQR